MQNRRRRALIGVALALGTAACGAAADEDAAVGTDAPAPSVAAAADDPVATESATAPPTQPSATQPSATQPDAAVEQTEPVVEEPTATDASAEPAPEATEAPAPPPAEPVLGGRLFAEDVQPTAQFDGNPFPDLVVDDIGNDARVNVRNILPSDRPVLLWAWAPH